MSRAAKFFGTLPQDALTDHETALRQVLLDWLHGTPGPLPLIEWIDRRIGGEVETFKDDQGCFSICLRGQRPAATSLQPHPPAPRQSVEAFFAKLPADKFDTKEEALRDAIFECLAMWKPLELATVSDLCSSPVVQKARAAFLPREVPVKDWIERRIGGEVELKMVAGGQHAVHLAPAAVALVKQKFQKLQAASSASNGGGKLGCKGGTPPSPANPPHMDNESFFASLPADDFSPKEVALREAIVDWIRRRASSGVTRPNLNEMQQDPNVQRCRGSLIPPKVSFKDWIERRIGGEIELRKAQSRKGDGSPLVVIEVFIRGEEEPTPVRAAMSAEDKAEMKEQFFASLPQDDFTNDECNLREALLNFLNTWKGNEQPTLSNAGEGAAVQQARKVLCPSRGQQTKGCGVTLKEWIDRRIGGEIETGEDAKGQVVFGLRGTLQRGSAHKRRKMG